MPRRHHGLPPLTALAAFEAAGRHASFKRAAEELSVTPGAVSHQIRALERDLGTRLFARVHRGVTLSPQGRRLFETVTHAFARMSREVAAIRDDRGDGTVTIGSTSAVAALWLSPMVNRFWRSHPDIAVDQIIRDGPSDHGDCDLCIRYGGRLDGNEDGIELYRDSLSPVADPSTASRLATADLATLARQPLVHLDSGDQRWTSWPEWFRACGYDGPISGGIRVNNYSIALQAAQDGTGLVLGWRRLIAARVRDGTLAFAGSQAIPAPRAFHLLCRTGADLPPAAATLRDWIVESARTRAGEPNSPEDESFPH